jgi:superfamily II DNA or RNA helicase
MGSGDGWSKFVIQSSRGLEGRRAMDGYQRQRRLAFAAPSKLKYLLHLLHRHRRDRVIIFTQDNATVYDISRRFLIPAITHQTKVTERSEILSSFSKGTYSAVVTSKVLNEGVDVPEANVAIVMSGSGSVREHVQRLGRVLRKKKDGGGARLYELVAGERARRIRAGEEGITLLTVDLVQSRRRGEQLFVRKFDPQSRQRAETLAKLYVGVAEASIGMTREAFDERASEIGVQSRIENLQTDCSSWYGIAVYSKWGPTRIL